VDDRRFDDLTRVLAAGPGSRRRLLAGSVAGLAAFLGIGRGRFPLEAAAETPNQFCQATFDTDPSLIVSKNGCGTTTCGGNPSCFCVQTVGHIPRCLIGFDPTPGQQNCPAKDQCKRHQDCRGNEFCAKVEGCCGRPRKKCLKPCPA
jgi:hypothetical protein